MRRNIVLCAVAWGGLALCGCSGDEASTRAIPTNDGGLQPDQTTKPDGTTPPKDGAVDKEGASPVDASTDKGAEVGEGDGPAAADSDGSSAGDGWKFGEWGDCKLECGAGSWQHTRRIWCVKGGVEYENLDKAIEQCGKQGQPETEKCDDSPCSVPQKQPCTGAISQVTEEPLGASTFGTIEGEGEFVGTGWRSNGGRIIYDLGGLRKHGFYEATIYDTLIPFDPPAQEYIEVQLLSGYEKPPYRWYAQAPNWPSHFAWRFGDTNGLGGIWKVAGHAINRDLPDYRDWQGWFDTFEKTPQSKNAVTYRFEWNVTELTIKKNGAAIKTFVFHSHEFLIQKLLVGPDDFFPQYQQGAWPVFFKDVRFGYDPDCQ